MHAAGDQKIARAFRRGFRQDRRFDLVETLLVEIAADGHRDPMTQADVVLQLRAPQVEIAILEPGLVGDGLIVSNVEWWRSRFVQHTEVAHANLDLSGRQTQVHRIWRSPLRLADHSYHELGADPFGALKEILVALDDDLSDAVPVAHVDEEQRSEVTDAMHPAEKNHLCADIGRTERATSVSTGQRTELFSHSLFVRLRLSLRRDRLFRCLESLQDLLRGLRA